MPGWKKSRHGATDAAAAFTLINRVVPTVGGFLCGICRATHATWSSATACVDACWSAQLEAQPTVAIRKGMYTLHRCRFCKREYPDFADAANCAAQCSDSLLKKTTSDASDLNNDYWENNDPQFRRQSPAAAKPLNYTIDPSTLSRMALHGLSKTVLMPFQVRNALISQHAMKPLLQAFLKNAAAIAIGKRPLGGNHHQGGFPVTQETEMKPANGGHTAKKDPNKKFFRDGARYVCAVCKCKHFTKLDVEACWEVH